MGSNGAANYCKHCGETFPTQAKWTAHWPACLAQAEERRGAPFYPPYRAKKDDEGE